MADDLEQLVLSISADTRQIQRALNRLDSDIARSTRGIEKQFDRAGKNIDTKFGKLFQSIGGGLNGPLESFAGRLGPVGAAMGALGPAGLLAGAGIGALTVAMFGGAQRLAETERLMNRLNGVLLVTGNASGLTATQIDVMASSLERLTGVDADEMRASAAALATFTSIGSENFERTLKIANDLATVFGGTLQQNVDKIARALDDPIAGFAALRKAGFALSDAELEVVKGLLRIGDTANAQRVVLKNLEDQIGGTAGAQNRGVAGAASAAGTSLGDFFEMLSGKLGLTALAEAGFRGLADGVNAVNDAAGRSELQSALDTLREYQAVKGQLQNAQANNNGSVGFGGFDFSTGIAQAETAGTDAGKAFQDAFNSELAGATPLTNLVDGGLSDVAGEIKASAAETAKAFENTTLAWKTNADAANETVRGMYTPVERLGQLTKDYKAELALIEKARGLDGDSAQLERWAAATEDAYARNKKAIETQMATEGRRNTSAAAKLDSWAREKLRYDEELIAISGEINAVGKSVTERDRLRYAIEMERVAREANRQAGLGENVILAEQSAWISQQSTLLAEKGEQLRIVTEQTKAADSAGQDFYTSFKSGVIDLIKGTKDLNGALADVLSKLGDMLLSSAFDLLKPSSGGGGGNWLNSIIAGMFPGREKGGPVKAGQPVIVGEKRPELFVPDSNGTIVPQVPSPSRSAQGFAWTFAPTINAPGADAGGMAAVREELRGMRAAMPTIAKKAYQDMRKYGQMK